MSNRNLTTSWKQVFGHVEKGTECRICGRNVDDGRAKFCSEYCRSLAKAVMNLLNWSGVRRIIIDRDDSTCQKCGFRQDWIDRAYGHIQEICEKQLPDKPEGPTPSDYDEWSDEELECYRKAADQWRDRRDKLIEKYHDREWRSFRWPSPESRLEVDHITPVSEGGHPFDPSNLWTLCEDCHQEKTAEENRKRDDKPEDRPEVPIQEYFANAVSTNE